MPGSSIRARWSAIGALVAVAIGSGTLALVSADSATPSSFVPITPCRLLDTRSTSPVGPRSTPILAGESLNVQVTGSNGSCVIPSTATAIVINVTAVGPSAAGYITLYPADVALPNASNLNFTANQNPTPNLVTVSLSAGGAIKIFNAAGTVNVLGDIAGYYQADVGTGNAGAACTAGGLPGVVVTGMDHDHNVSSKCFTNKVTTFAGSGTNANVDGQGLAASFRNPTAVAVDSLGNLYVADSIGNRIRKISPTGIVTTLAGNGGGAATDGPGATAEFATPGGVAVDSIGNVYVADTYNNRIRKISPLGVVSTLAGQTSSGHADLTSASASFNTPRAVATDSAGNVYVADEGNNCIRKVTPAGVVTTYAGTATNISGFVNGPAASARFLAPGGVAVDLAGNVYVADTGNFAIRKITTGGVVSTLAGGTQGFADGTGAAAQFENVTGVAVDAAGNVYAADRLNNRIRKISPAGVVTTLAGSSYGFVDGVGTAARFSHPAGVAVDNAGTVYVAEYDVNRIRRIQ